MASCQFLTSSMLLLLFRSQPWPSHPWNGIERPCSIFSPTSFGESGHDAPPSESFIMESNNIFLISSWSLRLDPVARFGAGYRNRTDITRLQIQCTNLCANPANTYQWYFLQRYHPPSITKFKSPIISMSLTI